MQEVSISKFNFEHCQKCGICNLVCPVMANSDIYKGPKQSGPDGERYRMHNGLFYEDALKYCMNCKRCEVACPSGVHIADMIQQAKIEYGHVKPKLRDMMLASTDLMGPLASTFAPIVNWGLGLKVAKEVLGATIKIAPERTMPKYAGETFVKWYDKNEAEHQKTFSKKLVFFHGCYANYNYPQLGKDFVAVMNALGYGVEMLVGERCCGVAKMTNGMINSARKDAIHNMKLIKGATQALRDVVTVSTSCTMTLRDEYPALLGVDNSHSRDRIVLAEQFIWRLIERGEVKLVWKKGYSANVAYHCPCHQRRLGWGIYTSTLLKMIPGLKLTELDANCCGIAGTYGFKKENYKLSQQVGKALFDQIAAVNPDFVACECETCKWQIEMSTGYKVVNPVSILADALDLEATEKLNR